MTNKTDGTATRRNSLPSLHASSCQLAVHPHHVTELKHKASLYYSAIPACKQRRHAVADRLWVIVVLEFEILHVFPHFLPILRYGKLHRPCIALQTHISGHNFGIAGPNLLKFSRITHLSMLLQLVYHWIQNPKFTFVESFLKAAATFSKTRLFGISRLLSLCSYQYVTCILSYRKSP